VSGARRSRLAVHELHDIGDPRLTDARDVPAEGPLLGVERGEPVLGERAEELVQEERVPLGLFKDERGEGATFALS
jgi:hypothetical protein